MTLTLRLTLMLTPTLQSVRDTPLDSLRDDLGFYLKVLRSSMIELINQVRLWQGDSLGLSRTMQTSSTCPPTWWG